MSAMQANPAIQEVVIEPPFNPPKNMLAFRHWFEGSKVVDDTGCPLVVYRGIHGEETDVFTTNLPTLVFTDTPMIASTYALNPKDSAFGEAKNPRVYPGFLDVQSPLDLRTIQQGPANGAVWQEDVVEAKALNYYLQSLEVSPIVFRDALNSLPWRDENGPVSYDVAVNNQGWTDFHILAACSPFIDRLKLNNFDGLIGFGSFVSDEAFSAEAQQSFDPVSMSATEYHAFNQKQVISAFTPTPQAREIEFAEKLANELPILKLDPLYEPAIDQVVEIETQLLELWGQTTEQARINASILEAHSKSWAQATGEPQSAFFKRWGIEISAKSREQFMGWFGDSKAVDDQGLPIVVYHGTVAAGFNAFDVDQNNIQGFHFSDSRRHAVTFAGSDRTPVDIHSDFFGQDPYKPEEMAHPGVYPVYLSLQNPLIIDFEGKGDLEEVDGFDMYAWIEMAEERGHDSAIFKNVEDGEGEYGVGLNWGKNVYVALAPEQIKSVANYGTFSADARILYQSQPPIFYSPVEQAIERFNFNSIPGPDLAKRLLKTPGVREEELESLGLIGWLEGAQQKLTKADVLNYVKANGIQVVDVIKQAENERQLLGDKYDQLRRKIQDAGGDRLNVEYLRGREDLTDLEYDLVEAYDAQDALADMQSGYGDSPTVYHEHILPGGVNYREVLLTIPELKDQNKFDPAKVEIQRHRMSTTQGSTSVLYDGEELASYGDDPQLQSGGAYLQKPESHWMEVAKHVFEHGDTRNKLKSRSNAFESSHWDELNVLAHVRLTDRSSLTATAEQITDIGARLAAMVGTDEGNLGNGAPQVGVNKKVITPAEAAQYSYARGFNTEVLGAAEKILFIEEIQSDWNREGRTKGFNDPAATEEYRGRNELAVKALTVAGMSPVPYDLGWLLRSYVHEDPRTTESIDRRLAFLVESFGEKWVADTREIMSKAGPSNTPLAPFVQNNNWQSLALKRVLRIAAEEGYDRVSWVSGQQIAEMNSLSRKISHVETQAIDGSESFHVFAEDKEGTCIEKITTKAELPNLLGKALAEKIIKFHGDQPNTGTTSPHGQFASADLSMDPAWSKNLYDRAVPNIMSKFGKKFRVGLDVISISNEEEQGGWTVEFEDGEKHNSIWADRFVADGVAKSTGGNVIPCHDAGSDQVSMRITPEMRADIMAGLPLFQDRDEQNKGSVLFTPGKTIIQAMAGADKSTFLHEAGHVVLESLKDMALNYGVKTEDWQVVKDWLGLKDNGPIPVAAHEKWANGFEVFMMEGKAPTSKLASVFETCKGWLKSIYKSADALGVALTNDIRTVMGGLLNEDERWPDRDAKHQTEKTLEPIMS